MDPAPRGGLLADVSMAVEERRCPEGDPPAASARDCGLSSPSAPPPGSFFRGFGFAFAASASLFFPPCFFW